MAGCLSGRHRCQSESSGAPVLANNPLLDFLVGGSVTGGVAHGKEEFPARGYHIHFPLSLRTTPPVARKLWALIFVRMPRGAALDHHAFRASRFPAPKNSLDFLNAIYYSRFRNG